MTFAAHAPVATVTVIPAAVDLPAGATAQLTAIAYDQSGNTMNGVAFTWATADTAIATVSPTGLVTAVGAGTVAITASSGGKSGSSTATVTAATPVVTTVTLSPSSATLSVGGTQQLTTTVKDQNGNTMSGLTPAYQSSDAAIASVSSAGLVTAVAGGQATITATVSDKSATSAITVSAPTVSGSRPDDAAPPVAIGMWATKAELDGIPASGSYWGEMVSAANGPWSVAGVESDGGGFYVRDAMAAALVFARLKPANGAPHAHADALRQKIRDAIAAEIALPFSSATDTRPGRHIGGWPIVADLINLPAYDPALESAFRAWLNRALDHVWSNGQSMRTLRGEHMHNRGAMARFSSAAAACYTRSSAEVDAVAQLMRRFYGDTRIQSVAGEHTPFSEPAGDGSGDTWQVQQPVSQDTRVGVGAAGATRDGNRFDGLMPGDIYRGTPGGYDPGYFPPDANGASYSYVEVTSYAHLGALHILHRCGHRDLVTYQSSAQLRSLQWLEWAAANYSSRGWSYFGLGKGSAQEAAMPLARYLYPAANLPAAPTRARRAGANYGYGWTWWLFGGRSL